MKTDPAVTPTCPPHDFSVVLNDDVKCSRCPMTGSSLIAQTEDGPAAMARRIAALEGGRLLEPVTLFEMSLAPRNGCDIEALEFDRPEPVQVYWDQAAKCWNDSGGLPRGEDIDFLGWLV